MVSNENKWRCRALVFSGLRDPEWEITPDKAASLIDLWKSSSVTVFEKEKEPVSGYKGCLLISDDGRYWRAFDGIIEYSGKGKKESRIDKGRTFEKGIMMTAPGNLQSTIFF